MPIITLQRAPGPTPVGAAHYHGDAIGEVDYDKSIQVFTHRMPLSEGAEGYRALLI